MDARIIIVVTSNPALAAQAQYAICPTTEQAAHLPGSAAVTCGGCQTTVIRSPSTPATATPVCTECAIAMIGPKQ